jgi:hypothetical protein
MPPSPLYFHLTASAAGTDQARSVLSVLSYKLRQATH